MTIPLDLDEPCGLHFVYRKFIECGETWAREAARSDPAGSFDNVPRVAETYGAMRALCAAVLDPVVNHFGPLELTYGFASPALTRRIAGRIAPALDQHAGHELSRTGKLICPRLGFAVDFHIPGRDSREILRWLAASTAFDRMVFYAPDLPIHVSVGPDCTRGIVHMRLGPSGRRIPRVLKLDRLNELG